MSTFRPHARHDAEADAIYVVLSEADVARSHSLDDLRVIDYSADGRVAGVEFLGVAGGVDLSDVPHSQKVEKAIGDLNLGIKVFA
ncbi:MAG TPA: DUF2283 domain-containing protein [Dehalococcoidia bacterium]|nr:DUF2283 domain-containing protein [Dehalococcoidia bacterium]